MLMVLNLQMKQSNILFDFWIPKFEFLFLIFCYMTTIRLTLTNAMLNLI